PPRSAEAGRELVAAGDRYIAVPLDETSRRHFVLRVADGEQGGHREARDLASDPRQQPGERPEIERTGAAMHVMPSRTEHDRIVTERLRQSGTLQVTGLEADHHQACAPALVLDQCV